MDTIVNAVVNHGTQYPWNDPAKRAPEKLKEKLSHELLRPHLAQLPAFLGEGVLQAPAHTAGIVYLLHAQAQGGLQGVLPVVQQVLEHGDQDQLRAVEPELQVVVRVYTKLLEGRQLLQALPGLRRAVELVRQPETLTMLHVDFVKACVNARHHAYAKPVVDMEIYDVSRAMAASPSNGVEEFLIYFYYSALIAVVLGEYRAAVRRFLTILTTPSTALSNIQADAYKRYVLCSLILHGEPQPLPSYVMPIISRLAQVKTYATAIAEAYKKDAAAVRSALEEHEDVLRREKTMGLAKHALAVVPRHKIRALTQTYVTLSLAEIGIAAGLDAASCEALLCNMIARGEVGATIDQQAQMVRFDEKRLVDTPQMAALLDERMARLLAIAKRIQQSERDAEVVLASATRDERGRATGDPSSLAFMGHPLTMDS